MCPIIESLTVTLIHQVHQFDVKEANAITISNDVLIIAIERFNGCFTIRGEGLEKHKIISVNLINI